VTGARAAGGPNRGRTGPARSGYDGIRSGRGVGRSVAGGAQVKRLRRVAFGVAVLTWVYCLTAHVLVVAGEGPTVLHPLVVGAIGTATIWAVHWPYRKGTFPDGPGPRFFVPLVVFSLACGLWPMAVGSGVPGDKPMLFGDGGVPGGEPGDRHLNNHGRRVRDLTEAEYQRTQDWDVVRKSGFSACISGMVLLYPLFYRRSGTTPDPKSDPPGAETADSENP
jgi:hypothetical protein